MPLRTRNDVNSDFVRLTVVLASQNATTSANHEDRRGMRAGNRTALAGTGHEISHISNAMKSTTSALLR
jgi:hypothetical protein